MFTVCRFTRFCAAVAAGVAISAVFMSVVDAKDAKVERIQRSLVLSGYDPGPVDGYWGSRTASALAEMADDIELVSAPKSKAGILPIPEIIDRHVPSHAVSDGPFPQLLQPRGGSYRRKQLPTPATGVSGGYHRTCVQDHVVQWHQSRCEVEQMNPWLISFAMNESEYHRFGNPAESELRGIGITSSPAFVRMPECNGCAERFNRTLKENLLWVRHFKSIEELRLALLEFRQIYNEKWIMQRHQYKTPAQFRRDIMDNRAMAA